MNSEDSQDESEDFDVNIPSNQEMSGVAGEQHESKGQNTNYSDPYNPPSHIRTTKNKIKKQKTTST